MDNINNPKISVLMPVYNAEEEYLREAIESILNQSYSDFEFIIINDGSTNNVENVILSYKDSRIKYIKQNNQGIANTLNNGLSIAKGEYIARMDADDISLPNRFEKQIKFMEEHPDISILGTWFEIFPKSKVIKHPSKPSYFDFLTSSCIGHPTVMFRRNDFEKYDLMYNPNYKCEDYELWSRAIRYLKFANLQEVLLKYRWHDNNLSKPSKQFKDSTAKVCQSMLKFLTNDENLQDKIFNYLLSSQIRKKYTLAEKIFSIRNEYRTGEKQKIIMLLGLIFKIKVERKKTLIVELRGGLGNQMFQYAFGKALAKASGQQVLYDNSWFKKSQKTIVNEKGEDNCGVKIRPYDMDIFNLDIEFANSNQVKKCKKHVIKSKEFEFEKNLLKPKKSAIYRGYFQNEGYLKDIKDEIKKDFTFPEISDADEYNQNWLKKIKSCENPVFIHFRRGDYVNLGWDLSINYYKKAIDYIKKNVQNPTFFVFGQECESFINDGLLCNSELDSESFNIIGEENSKNKQDWKDIVLMKECKHAIIANSTFSWWSAWLGRANQGGIVIAPTPFVNGKDGIICDDWVKIER